MQAGQAAAKPTAAAAAAAATVPAPAAPAPSSSAAALTYTSYEGNSFYVQFKSGRSEAEAIRERLDGGPRPLL